MAALAAVPIFAGIIVFGAFMRGVVFSDLWQWFVVERFHVPSLSIWQAAGLGLVAGFLTYQYDARNSTEEKKWYELAVEWTIVAVFLNGFIWLCGFGIHELAT